MHCVEAFKILQIVLFVFPNQVSDQKLIEAKIQRNLVPNSLCHHQTNKFIDLYEVLYSSTLLIDEVRDFFSFTKFKKLSLWLENLLTDQGKPFF